MKLVIAYEKLIEISNRFNSMLCNFIMILVVPASFWINILEERQRL